MTAYMYARSQLSLAPKNHQTYFDPIYIEYIFSGSTYGSDILF